ncbi:Uncharacterised ACR, COG2135 [Ralstonia mannitolilytica]|uniref:SOS response-associated peptidase family protein n=1 Tax=Ralstonia mannitolilytica TaxID=105219 RepID=UPI000E08C8DF|nr:SOS response-associated peptidase family protein [Ralstonia mannitolilytica]SUD94209.1 Uncharacterised ACR, COG2135 [Ralstonia mannitolilytica]
MCYSAQIKADYKRFVSEYGAIMSLDEFTRLVTEYFKNPGSVKFPKAMTAPFLESPETEEEKKIAEVLRAGQEAEEIKLLQELAKQRERLEKARAAVERKATKTATEELRKASNKVAWVEGKLDELRSNEIKPRDSRIFPGWYAPVMIWENGRRVIKPMRYQCRPAGKPEFYDTKYPGTYNARMENLRGFWKGQYGHTHGVVLVDAFYENVKDAQGRNIILGFRPDPPQTMIVACLWSHWRATKPGEKDLLSFAIITTDPPPEISEAGHDRCPVPIKSEDLDAWLNPDPNNVEAMDKILADNAMPHFTHSVAG